MNEVVDIFLCRKVFLMFKIISFSADAKGSDVPAVEGMGSYFSWRRGT